MIPGIQLNKLQIDFSLIETLWTEGERVCKMQLIIVLPGGIGQNFSKLLSEISV